MVAAEEASRLAASCERHTASGVVRRFPNRSDFEAHVFGLRRGDGSYDPQLASDVMLTWIARGQTGCSFATLLAAAPIDAKWITAAVPERLDQQHLAALFAALVSEPPEALMVTFPYVDSPKQLAELVEQLASLPGWRGHLGDSPAPGHISVALRWDMPGQPLASWVLGFAPFDFMPFTRRAPFAAVVYRPTPQYVAAIERKHEDGIAGVHLADLPINLPEDEFDKRWAHTERVKKNLLAGELEHAAKAKVAFVLPDEIADQLHLE